VDGKDGADPELVEQFRQLFGYPDTHPADVLTAACHEAAHVVVAAAHGYLATSVRLGIGATEASGAMQVALPEHFRRDTLAHRLRNRDARVVAAAVRDIRAVCSIYLASLAFYEVHCIGAKWSCLGDVLEASAFLDLLPAELEHDLRMWRLVDGLRPFFRRKDVEEAAFALTAELLEHREVGAVEIWRACAGLLPATPRRA